MEKFQKAIDKVLNEAPYIIPDSEAGFESNDRSWITHKVRKGTPSKQGEYSQGEWRKYSDEINPDTTLYVMLQGKNITGAILGEDKIDYFQVNTTEKFAKDLDAVAWPMYYEVLLKEYGEVKSGLMQSSLGASLWHKLIREYGDVADFWLEDDQTGERVEITDPAQVFGSAARGTQTMLVMTQK